MHANSLAQTCTAESFESTGALLVGEAAEEAGWFPLRAVVGVGDS